MALNAVLIHPLLTETTFLDSETSATNLLKVFTKCIAAKGSEEEDDKSAKEEEDGVTIEGGDTKDKSKHTSKENAKTLDTIAANCD